jgi:sec-independent protein translocase protein TatA
MSLGVPELLIVLAIVLLVLGPKRLPRLGRQLGSGIREFRDSIARRASDEDDEDTDADTPTRLPPGAPGA